MVSLSVGKNKANIINQVLRNLGEILCTILSTFL